MGTEKDRTLDEHPLMQSYGSPLQQPAVYHHGELYPHSDVVVGDTGSITIDERSSENIGFLDGKSGEKENVASFSGNDGADKSALNGRKDSFDESDDTVTHECFPTKKRSYSEFAADDAQNRSTSQYSDANPVSVLEVPLALKDRPIESSSGVSFSVASAMQIEPQAAKLDKWIQEDKKFGVHSKDGGFSVKAAFWTGLDPVPPNPTNTSLESLEDPVALKDRPIESGSGVSFSMASAMQVELRAAKPMQSQWEALPTEILETICGYMLPQDIVRVGSVCRTWGGCVKEGRFFRRRQIPWVLLDDGDQCPTYLRLYSISERRRYDIRVSEDNVPISFFGSFHSWVFVCKLLTGESSLFNPWSRATVLLPRTTQKSISLALSRLDLAPGICRVAVLGACKAEIRYCTIGDEHWSYLGLAETTLHAIVFYQGLLYLLDHHNLLWVANLGDANPAIQFCGVLQPALDVVAVAEIVRPVLLVRGDQLLLLFEIVMHDQNQELVSDFEIFLLNWETLSWELQVIDLDDMFAIFISSAGTGIALAHDEIGYGHGGYVFCTAVSHPTHRDLLPLSELHYQRVMRYYLPDEHGRILVEDEFNWPSMWLVAP